MGISGDLLTTNVYLDRLQGELQKETAHET